jgi:hypothetical protein
VGSFFIYTRAMKAIIKVCTATKAFTPDQQQILKRIANVLIEHGFVVAITTKVKKTQVFNLKVV